EAHQLIFDVGPLGCPVSGGHGHADALSVLCSVFGEPFFVDSGTHCYHDGSLRNGLRVSAAHNTLTIDGHSQAEPAGPFSWKTRPQSELLSWSPQLIDAQCTANGFVHRRQLVLADPGFWLIVDDVLGDDTHDITLRFHLAPGLRVERAGDWLHIN